MAKKHSSHHLNPGYFLGNWQASSDPGSESPRENAPAPETHPRQKVRHASRDIKKAPAAPVLNTPRRPARQSLPRRALKSFRKKAGKLFQKIRQGVKTLAVRLKPLLSKAGKAVRAFFTFLGGAIRKGALALAALFRRLRARLKERRAGKRQKKEAKTIRAETEKAVPKAAVSEPEQAKNAEILPENAPESAEKEPLPADGSAFARSLDGAYGVWQDPGKNKKRPLRAWDVARYAMLFAAVFGFLLSAFLVARKLYGYYQTRAVYQKLRDLVNAGDPFEDEYMTHLSFAPASLKISDLMSGKTVSAEGEATALSRSQQNIVSKLKQLKALNGDLSAWITISGTVVDYPVMWSQSKSYYLHRDFYGNYLAAGTLYIDNRNSRNVWENRNTVIYGHNMYNGSMFASLHDFESASVFYNTRIEILTENGVFVYTPFSVHESIATENYFETDFVNDADFLDFCQEMQLLSLHSYEIEFEPDSRLLTLSTCTDNNAGGDHRWVVHAVLTGVIR